MHWIKILIPAVLFCLPVKGWSANLQYVLDVQIDTKERKITGIVRLKANADKKIDLSVRHLRKLKVDGNPVMNTSNETITLAVEKGKETLISYEALFAGEGANFIDRDNVFLTGDWYPLPDGVVEYSFSVTLPKDFMANSEADAITVEEQGETKTFRFQFRHPLDTLHLAASNRYVLKKDRHNDITIEAYFFKEDAHLAATYIAHTK